MKKLTTAAGAPVADSYGAAWAGFAAGCVAPRSTVIRILANHGEQR